MFPLLILLGIGTSLIESHGYVRRVGHCVTWSLGGAVHIIATFMG